MKTFEEKFTAWVDGALTGAELAAFERELQADPEGYKAALAEKEDAHSLGKLLRQHAAPAPLRNADFFNHQLLQQIEGPAPREKDARPAVKRALFWTLPRMAFSGAFMLLLAMVLYFTAVPNTRRDVQKRERYVENVLNAHSDDPSITATSFHSKAANVNVVWLDGLSYMPREHKLK